MARMFRYLNATPAHGPRRLGSAKVFARRPGRCMLRHTKNRQDGPGTIRVGKPAGMSWHRRDPGAALQNAMWPCSIMAGRSNAGVPDKISVPSFVHIRRDGLRAPAR